MRAADAAHEARGVPQQSHPAAGDDARPLARIDLDLDDDLTGGLAVGDQLLRLGGGEAFGDLLQTGESLDDLGRQPSGPYFEVIAAVSRFYPEVKGFADLARDPSR